MDEKHIRESAATLSEWLTERWPPARELFSIGVGTDRLHVYVRCSAQRWSGEHTARWNNVPVEWHFGVGQIRALDAHG